MLKIAKIFFPSLIIIFLSPIFVAHADYHFSDFQGRSPIHIYASDTKSPEGMTPSQIKNIYNLPSTGGKGTIVIVGAYDDPTIENDLAIFDKQFNLPDCGTANKCFTKHKMSSSV